MGHKQQKISNVFVNQNKNWGQEANQQQNKNFSNNSENINQEKQPIRAQESKRYLVSDTVCKNLKFNPFLIQKSINYNQQQLQHPIEQIAYIENYKNHKMILITFNQYSTTSNLLEYSSFQPPSCAIEDIGGYLLSRFVDDYKPSPIKIEQFLNVRRTNITNYYELHEIIGEGAFGVVMRATCLSSKEQRAVKLIKQSVISNKRVKNRLNQKISLLHSLSHPNIIHLYDIFIYDQTYYFVYELCLGGTLGSLLKNKTTPVEYQTIKKIIEQLFFAINYLHSQNIIHRDIKPQNIMFTRKISLQSQPQLVDLKIIDFGLAIKKEGQFKDWKKIGTYAYMAPQIFKGIYSSKCDSWACGVIIYEIFIRKNPFKFYDTEQIKQKIISFNINFDTRQWKNVNEEVKSLIGNLLDPDYKTRLSLENALKHPFFNFKKFTHKQWLYEKIISYHRGNNLIAAYKLYLSCLKLSPLQRHTMGNIFNSIDLDHDGFIDLQEIKVQIGSNDDNDLAHIFRKINLSETGFINFSQFCCMLLNQTFILDNRHIKNLFEYIDFSCNQLIEKQELSYFLKGDKEQYFTKISSKTDKITFQQFLSYMTICL